MTGHVTWRAYKHSCLDDPEIRVEYEVARCLIELGDTIRRLREAKGMGKAELARRVGSNTARISRLELGGTDPTVGLLSRISAALATRLQISFAEPPATEAWDKVSHSSQNSLQTVGTSRVSDS